MHVVGEDEFTKVDTTEEALVDEKTEPPVIEQPSVKPRYTFWTSLCASFITLRRGWKIYTRYDVAFAGLSLASLYLTVLGFHTITVGKQVAHNYVIVHDL